MDGTMPRNTKETRAVLGVQRKYLYRFVEMAAGCSSVSKRAPPANRRAGQVPPPRSHGTPSLPTSQIDRGWREGGGDGEGGDIPPCFWIPGSIFMAMREYISFTTVADQSAGWMELTVVL